MSQSQSTFFSVFSILILQGAALLTTFLHLHIQLKVFNFIHNETKHVIDIYESYS